MSNLGSTRIGSNYSLEMFSQTNSRLTVTGATIPSDLSMWCYFGKPGKNFRGISKPRFRITLSLFGKIIFEWLIPHCNTSGCTGINAS